MIGNVEIPHRTVLAPMAGVTNSAFRTIAKEFGAEFTDLKAENEDDYSDELEEKMDELDTVGHIDLVKEEESGYSIMWID